VDADDRRKRIAAACHSLAQIAQNVPQRPGWGGRPGGPELLLDALAVGVSRQRDPAAEPPPLALPMPQPLQYDQGCTGEHSEREEHYLLDLLVLVGRQLARSLNWACLVRLAGVARLVGLEAAVPGLVMPGAESPTDPLMPLVLVSMAVLPVLVGGSIGGRDTDGQ
jgi:hypothetical protein